MVRVLQGKQRHVRPTKGRHAIGLVALRRERHAIARTAFEGLVHELGREDFDRRVLDHLEPREQRLDDVARARVLVELDRHHDVERGRRLARRVDLERPCVGDQIAARVDRRPLGEEPHVRRGEDGREARELEGLPLRLLLDPVALERMQHGQRREVPREVIDDDGAALAGLRHLRKQVRVAKLLDDDDVGRGEERVEVRVQVRGHVDRGDVRALRERFRGLRHAVKGRIGREIAEGRKEENGERIHFA